MKTKTIGITLVALMLASVFAAVVPTSLGKVNAATQTITSYSKTFKVNYDNISVQLEGTASAVVVGQTVQFSDTNDSAVGQVTLTGVSGTDTEGEVVFSDSTGKLETAGMVTGPYDATATNATATRINIGTKRGELALRDEADTKDISSVTKGSKFRVKFTHSLDSNDGVDLKVSGPANYKQNPADTKVFENINVSMLSGANALIDTTGWALGTYTLYITTNEQYARGLALTTNEKTLQVISGKVDISADKTEVAKGEKVKVTVTGVAGDSITMTAEDGEFPVGEYDNPNAAAAATFNHTIDADGIRTYIVKFTDTGSKKVKVAVWAGDQAGKDADVSITVVKRKVVFDVPSTAVVGEKVDIKGSVTSGTDLDLVIEDAGKVINDEPVDENKEFSVEWDTAKLTTGSYKIEAFIDSSLSTLSQYTGVDEDGSVTIRLVTGDLTANQVRNVVAEDDDYTIEGTATGVDNVDIVLIGPKGTSVSTVTDVADGLYITSVSVTDDEFTEDVTMGGSGFDTGSWIVVVASPGRDGTYGNLALGAGELKNAVPGQIDFGGKDQAQILAIMQDATVDVAGSDDLLVPLSFRVESAYVNLNPADDVGVGDPLEISGVTNREPETTITISTFAGPMELAALTEVEWPTANEGVFNATIDTTDAAEGTYTFEADDGDGNTATVTVTIGAAAPTAAPTATPEATPTATAAPTAPPTVAPTEAATAAPEETAEAEEPGFEALFAIAGLLAVAYLVLRVKK